MAYNLVISYDLTNETFDYTGVERAVRSLGPAVRVLYSTWVVRSQFDCVSAEEIVWRALDAGDRLIVAESNRAAWRRLKDGTEDEAKRLWNS